MENHGEFQLLKLKVASEIVRSSQAAVAFSRAFYLEEVLIDKIGQELKDLHQEHVGLQTKIDDLLQSVDNEEDDLTENMVRCFCSKISGEFQGKSDELEEFEQRRQKAEARRQAKSSLMQRLSTNELMSKFESLTLSELREVQVPEFSCFINESDFGLLEKLNQDWSLFRQEAITLLKSSFSQVDQQISTLQSYRNQQSECQNSHSHSLPPEVPLEEIGKTFANRSGSVLRKFSTLLSRGKRSSKSYTEEF